MGRPRYWWTRISAVPVYLVAIGLVLTVLIAMLQQSNAQRERELLFAAESGRITDAVIRAIDDRAGDLSTSINFIATTHPAPLDDVRAFFAREYREDEILPDDPGVILIEEVGPSGLDTLIERERRLGHDDFAVRTVVEPGGSRLIITRTGRDRAFLGMPLVGLDTTLFRERLIPSDLPESGFVLRVVDPDSLLAMIAPDPQAREPQADVDEVFALLLGRVNDEDGELIGYGARFWAISELLSDVELGSDLDIAIGVDGIDTAVLTTATADSVAPELAELRGRHEVTTASLMWTIDVWADADFGPAVGFWHQRGLLIAGVVASLLSGLLVVVYDHHRRVLHEAEFELEHARTLASTDPLTGLLNRQGIVDAARDVPPERSATVFFVDLDGFKTVNDERGHDEGDRVLREVARRLRRIFRSTDVVGRIGGDEFVVFTPEAQGERYTKMTSERITSAVASIDADVTCSVGVVSRATGEGTDINELVRSADQAMYSAKRAGGDQHAVSDVD